MNSCHSYRVKDKCGGGVSGEVGEVTKVMRFVFYRLHRMGLETLEVGKGKVDILRLKPGNDGGDGVIGDLRQGGDGCPNEMPRRIADGRDEEDEDCECEPLIGNKAA